MKLTKILIVSVLLLGTNNTLNAQFWKKITKKVQDKIEQKVEAKIDKETDKAIDKTLDGKKKTVPKKGTTELNKNRNKDFGDFSISHTTKFGNVTVEELGQTKIIKEGNSFKLYGSWWSHEADIHDGYVLVLNNGINIEEINKKGKFLIPSEATLKLSYDPSLPNKATSENGLSRAVTNNYQTYSIVKGSVTINIQKNQKVAFSFNGETELVTSVVENSNGDLIKTKANSMVLGTFKTIDPEFILTKQRENKKNLNNNSAITESDKNFIKGAMLPTVNIPSTFNFNKSIEVKMTDESGETQNIDFLTGKYPDIYGMSIASKEMKGQQMLIVTTPKSTSMFMDMAGMKIKKSMSLEQVSRQYNVSNNMPEDGDYSYKKTGKTKTIIGYLCEEVKVEYNHTNSQGSISFWLSKDFPIQNKTIPMLGMKMNNVNFSGFVLEMNTVQNGKKFTIQVVNVSDQNVSIDTTSYKSLGF